MLNDAARRARPPPPQPVRSFKVRGAYNKMSRLTPEQLARGVICSSAGNHAQVGGAMLVRRLASNLCIGRVALGDGVRTAAVRDPANKLQLAPSDLFGSIKAKNHRGRVCMRPALSCRRTD
jgi:threonine dehydratase